VNDRNIPMYLSAANIELLRVGLERIASDQAGTEAEPQAFAHRARLDVHRTVHLTAPGCPVACRTTRNPRRSSTVPTPPVTAFAETAALYAVLNEDYPDARRIVTDMTAAERAEFAGQLDRLRSMLTDEFGNDISIADHHTCLLPAEQDCRFCGRCKHRCPCSQSAALVAGPLSVREA
jgi:hypothetical protein